MTDHRDDTARSGDERLTDDEMRLYHIRRRRSNIAPMIWKDEITEDGDLIVYAGNPANQICFFGDMEITDREDHCNAEFVANAPADIDYLLEALAEARGAAAKAEEMYALLAEAANRETELMQGALTEQKRMFAEWLDDRGYKHPDGWSSGDGEA